MDDLIDAESADGWPAIVEFDHECKRVPRVFPNHIPIHQKMGVIREQVGERLLRLEFGFF
jgi:hypothetical protein